MKFRDTEILFIRKSFPGKSVNGEDELRREVRKCLSLADEQKRKNLTLPELTPGIPEQDFLRVLGEELFHYLRERESTLKNIRIPVSSKKSPNKLKKTMGEYIGYLQRKQGDYPIPTVDIIIEMQGGFILIERKNPPYGWAIPGGFVDYGESLEQAARREAKEETNLGLKNLTQLHVYSHPGRDPRFHTISTVFVAEGTGKPMPKSDALNLKIFNRKNLPEKFAFDHKKIIKDYFAWKEERGLGICSPGSLAPTARSKKRRRWDLTLLF